MDLIALEFYGYEFKLGEITCRLGWLPQGAELDNLKAFGAYLTECGWLDD